jgi:hypothetical protein
MQKYYTEVLQYTTNYNLTSNCNGISFTNTGSSTLFVNKYKLTPGATLSINGNYGELDTTQYKINFPANSGECTIIRKMYIA